MDKDINQALNAAMIAVLTDGIAANRALAAGDATSYYRWKSIETADHLRLLQLFEQDQSLSS